ncbi:MMPL family transporter [Paenibacillus sp. FA6]|uniref:MMPL family transporter n=1 Tax=Paenibacillus sp. FA6 TaxID=3413029 RepID=UPI003F65A792
MKKIKNWRVASFVLWVVITVVIVMTMPDMDQLVRDKGQISISDTAQSEVAQSMMDDMSTESGGTYQIIAVFNSGTDEKLTSQQKEHVEDVIVHLKEKESELGIKQIVSHMDNEQTEAQLLSEDQTTILTQISIQRDQGTISEVADRLRTIVHMDSVDTYLTGTGLVLEDFSQSTQEGVQKTEIIAIVFIILVLILVFRSPVVPFISLLSVGISYLVSMGIIAHMVDKFNYPFSNFTQVFLVVILFGIGTDYNILLFTRFKEELSKTENVLDAVKETYKASGKTVLYSGLAVFIGFMALLLAEFRLYQASSAVAIGVAILILVLMTLNPFFMALLGKKMFWPLKRFEGHGESKVWAFLAKTSVARPLVALLFVAIICIPFLIKYSDSLSYNDLLEVDNGYESKQGINVIEDHYSLGFSSPSTLVIRSDQPLDDTKSLQVLDELAEKISNVDGVSKVFTSTRPAGEQISELYIKDQAKVLKDGLGDAKDGVGQINEGLSSAEDKFSTTESSGVDNVQKLIDGTNEVKNGVSALGDALRKLTMGMEDGVKGAEKLDAGLDSIQDNMKVLLSSTSKLLEGYSELNNGLASFRQHFTSIGQAIEGARQGYEQIESSMTKLLQTNPELIENVNVQTSLAVASGGKQQLVELSTKLNDLTKQYDSAMVSFKQANTSLAQVDVGYSKVQAGVNQLQEGSGILKEGIQTAVDGSSQMASQAPELETGLVQINDGQEQLLSGLSDLSDQMETLQTGLSESTKGLGEVSNGLMDAQDYLSGLSESQASEKFYIPEDIFKSDDFQKALNMYMSDDRTITQMNIILDVNPYSKEAMSIVRKLKETVHATLNDSVLSDAEIAIGGKTSQNIDLEEISSSDFARTATIMLIGIGFVLIIITRSLLKPVFIIGSLILAYYTSLGISELLSTNMFGVDALGWNVPFFSFIMIVALGVDYSIFLMMRYRELEDDSAQAIVDAARHIGGVVISAAIILGGTFASLIPSGVLTLIEVAITVIIGLFLLSFVMLPILIPALLGAVDRLQRLGKKTKEK